MSNFRHRAIHSPHDGNDIEAATHVDLAILDIVIHGQPQVLQLLVIDGKLRISQPVATTGLHLYKNKAITVLGNDIDVTMTGMPIALQNDVTFLSQINYCHLFAPNAYLQMMRAFVRKLLPTPASIQ